MADKGLLSRVFSLIKTAFKGSFSETLSKTHGHIGRLFGAVVDIFRAGDRATPEDVARSSELLQQSGFSESDEPNPEFFTYETVVQQPSSDPDQLEIIRYGEPTGPIVLGGNDVARRPTFDVNVVPSVGVPGSRNQRITREALLRAMSIDDGSESDVISNLIQTPHSSNVYAFGFDAQSGILYVQYKAGGTPTHYTAQMNTCNGKLYQMGHKAHIAGPLYAYGSRAKPVPESVFREMKNAASKGEFVWERLRVCGSLWEHQYPYQLVTPTMIPLGNGAFGAYTPRKASRQGFRVRTVATIGSGRRPFLISNLPGYNNPRGLRK